MYILRLFYITFSNGLLTNNSTERSTWRQQQAIHDSTDGHNYQIITKNTMRHKGGRVHFQRSVFYTCIWFCVNWSVMKTKHNHILYYCHQSKLTSRANYETCVGNSSLLSKNLFQYIYDVLIFDSAEAYSNFCIVCVKNTLFLTRLFWQLFFYIITVRKVIFSQAPVSHSVHMGGRCIPACTEADTPPRQTPPGAEPPWTDTPPGQTSTPSWADTPPSGQTPP